MNLHNTDLRDSISIPEFDIPSDIQMGDDEVFTECSINSPSDIVTKKITRSHSMIDLRELKKINKYNLPLPKLDIVTKITKHLNKNKDKLQFKIDSFDYRELTSNELKLIDYYNVKYSVNLDIYYLDKPKNMITTDKNGFFIPYINTHVLFRYQIIEALGKGTYSTVIRCTDHKHKHDYALKLIRSNRKFKSSYKNELECLQLLNNNIEKYDKISESPSEFITKFYDTFNWIGHDVLKLKIYNKNLYSADLNPLDMAVIRVIMIDIFEGLNFVKQQGIIHCDLKPENIFFINYEYNVVIGDFGLSIICNDEYQEMWNVQTRWYRSPEIILNMPYMYPIDMWSAGAIMLELLISRAIFSSRDEYELYYIIERVIGSECPYITGDYNPKFTSFMRIYKTKINVYNKSRTCERIDEILTLIKNKNIEEINYLMNHIFRWEPRLRITPYLAAKYLIDTSDTPINI